LKLLASKQIFTFFLFSPFKVNGFRFCRIHHTICLRRPHSTRAILRSLQTCVLYTRKFEPIFKTIRNVLAPAQPSASPPQKLARTSPLGEK